MSSSNVRSIESLEAFHGGLVRIAEHWEQSLQEIRMMIGRAEEYFAQERPAYWRRQKQLAEQELNEAKELLSQRRSAARPGDRLPASEQVQRVRRAEQRLRDCEDKQRESKRWAIEMAQQCDEVLGPLAHAAEHCEVVLPNAAQELKTLIEQLRVYAERTKGESS